MPSSPVDLSAAPRAVVGTAADLIYKVGLSMLGADRVPTAKANAWAAVCAEAATVAPEGAAAFFRDRFDWVSVGGGKAFATGYYEPEIAGSRTPLPGYVPIHGVPTDLMRCTRADGQTGRGRIDETGVCVLYYTRPEIEDGAIANRAPVLAWAAGAVVRPTATSIAISRARTRALMESPRAGVVWTPVSGPRRS